MPLYDYQCSDCQKIIEVRHGFDAPYGAACDACGGVLKRIFNPAPILFKGSGFYVTDSRKPAASEGGAAAPAAPASPPAGAAPASPTPAPAPAPPAKESAA